MPYLVHPSMTKMYRDLKEQFWWIGMKREIAEFTSKCVICQKIKAEHKRPSSKLQLIKVPKWK